MVLDWSSSGNAGRVAAEVVYDWGATYYVAPTLSSSGGGSPTVVVGSSPGLFGGNSCVLVGLGAPGLF